MSSGIKHFLPIFILRLVIPTACSVTCVCVSPVFVCQEDLPDWIQEMFGDDFCQVCSIPLSSITVADDHYAGKKHMKKCRALLNMNKLQVGIQLRKW